MEQPTLNSLMNLPCHNCHKISQVGLVTCCSCQTPNPLEQDVSECKDCVYRQILVSVSWRALATSASVDNVYRQALRPVQQCALLYMSIHWLSYRQGLYNPPCRTAAVFALHTVVIYMPAHNNGSSNKECPVQPFSGLRGKHLDWPHRLLQSFGAAQVLSFWPRSWTTLRARGSMTSKNTPGSRASSIMTG